MSNDNQNDDQQNNRTNNENTNTSTAENEDGINKPPNVRIRHYPDHEKYPDNGEDAVAIVQFTTAVANGCEWTGENIPIGLQTDDGLYRMEFTPEFIDELRTSPYWDTVTERLDEQDRQLTGESE